MADIKYSKTNMRILLSVLFNVTQDKIIFIPSTLYPNTTLYPSTTLIPLKEEDNK